jgi:hypothetical protein
VTPRRLLPLLLGAGLLLAACMDQRPPSAPSEPRLEVLHLPSRHPVPPPVEAEPLPEELLALPMMPAEMSALADAVQQRFANSPDLGTTEISLDRTVLTVRWFGDPPPELRTMLDAHQDAPFEIRLEQTRFRQGDLMTEAGRLLREHPGVVTVTGTRNEGDGVIVGIDPEVIDSPDQADLAAYGITSRFPLFPRAESQPVPASG